MLAATACDEAFLTLLAQTGARVMQRTLLAYGANTADKG